MITIYHAVRIHVETPGTCALNIHSISVYNDSVCCALNIHSISVYNDSVCCALNIHSISVYNDSLFVVSVVLTPCRRVVTRVLCRIWWVTCRWETGTCPTPSSLHTPSHSSTAGSRQNGRATSICAGQTLR